MSALKDAAKTAYAGVKGVINREMTKAMKEGWGLVAKKIGLEVTKKIGTEITKELVNIGVDKALIPQVESAIKAIFAPMIIAALQSNKNVKKWLDIDATNRNGHYQSIILNLAIECLSNEKNKGAFRKIAEGIADQCFSQSDNVEIAIECLFNENNKGAFRKITEGIADQCVSQSDYVGKYSKWFKHAINLGEVLIFTHQFLGKFEKAIEAEAKNLNQSETNDVSSIETNQGKKGLKLFTFMK